MPADRTADFAAPRHVENTDDCFFYHTLDLPGFGEQKGEWDLRGRFADYSDHYDFTGKSVLDIGTGSGFLSFSAEQGGATDVVSFDMDSTIRQDFLPFRDKPYFQDRADLVKQRDWWLNQWKNAYWLSHRLLDSKARTFYGDVYDMPEGLGQFDVVILGSILEHLADPIKAMTSAAKRSSHTILIVTPMIESDDRIARFEGDCMRPDDDYVFWTYSEGIYHHVLNMLGFDIAKIARFEFTANWSEEPEVRHVITAVKKGA
jgi:SAM-dependent methyltransferase